MERFHEYFEHGAIRLQYKIALTVDGRSTTYRKLLDYTWTIAETLYHLGVPAGARVAICSEMSMNAVAAAFGILKTGCVLVCVQHMNSTVEHLHGWNGHHGRPL